MPPKFTFNTQDKTASFDLFNGVEFITSYSYNEGIVTLSERLNIDDITKEQLRSNLDEIATFIKYITETLQPIPSYHRGDFLEKITKNPPDNVKADFEVEGIVVTDAKWRVPQQDFRFQPRVEVQLNFFCFRKWIDFLNRFYREGIEF